MEMRGHRKVTLQIKGQNEKKIYIYLFWYYCLSTKTFYLASAAERFHTVTEPFSPQAAATGVGPAILLVRKPGDMLQV